jgi:hypothetical protein
MHYEGRPFNPYYAYQFCDDTTHGKFIIAGMFSVRPCSACPATTAFELASRTVGNGVRAISIANQVWVGISRREHQPFLPITAHYSVIYIFLSY